MKDYDYICFNGCRYTVTQTTEYSYIVLSWIKPMIPTAIGKSEIITIYAVCFYKEKSYYRDLCVRLSATLLRKSSLSSL